MIWRSTYHSRIAQLADLLTVLFAFILSYYVWKFLFQIYPGAIAKPFLLSSVHIILMTIYACIYVVIFNFYNAYSYQRFTSLFSEFLIVLKVSLLGGLICLTILFLLGYGNLPRILFVLSSFISLTLSILALIDAEHEETLENLPLVCTLVDKEDWIRI